MGLRGHGEESPASGRDEGLRVARSPGRKDRTRRADSRPLEGRFGFGSGLLFPDEQVPALYGKTDETTE